MKTSQRDHALYKYVFILILFSYIFQSCCSIHVDMATPVTCAEVGSEHLGSADISFLIIIHRVVFPALCSDEAHIIPA